MSSSAPYPRQTAASPSSSPPASASAASASAPPPPPARRPSGAAGRGRKFRAALLALLGALAALAAVAPPDGLPGLRGLPSASPPSSSSSLPPPPPPPRPQTDEGRACSALRSRLGLAGGLGVGSGPSGAWRALAGRVLEASMYPPEHAGHPDLGPAFRAYVSSVFGFYTPARLRRTSARPPDARSVRRLLGLVGRWHRHRAAAPGRGGNASEPEPDPEPVRILVLGGSVTYGVRCAVNSEVPGLPPLGETDCAWPARLEKMLNAALGPEAPPSASSSSSSSSSSPPPPGPFRVANAAIRATSSETGAALLEGGLLGDPDRPPHVVVSSYSTNDALDRDLDESSHRHQEGLVRAALRLRPPSCGGGDDELPLVVLADDLHPSPRGAGLDSGRDLEVTGRLYRVAAWYRAAMVDYAGAVRPAALAAYPPRGRSRGGAAADAAEPLFGSAYDNVHLGTGFHLGMAWAVLFNLLGAVADACGDVEAEAEAAGREGGGSAAAAAAAPPYALEEPPARYLGPIADADAAAAEWRDRLRRRDEECAGRGAGGGGSGGGAGASAAGVAGAGPPEVAADSAASAAASASPAPRPKYSTAACPYGWVANPAGLYTPEAIADALRPALVRQSGWAYRPGSPWESPCFAAGPGAAFELALGNVTGPVRHLNVFYTLSHRPTFENSKLELAVRVEHPAAPAAGDPPGQPQGELGTYEIDAHQTYPSSVVVPAKFRLPGAGAGAGDTVRVEARLVSGQEFRIAGLALCR